MSVSITMSSAKELVLDVLKAKLVPFLQSSPGIGKSSLAREIAEENNLELIDIRLSQLDPVDLLGLPFKEGTKASYLPMNLFPLEGDPIPEGKAGFLLLMDEFSSASMAVQSASYRVILDREVGQHQLHSRCAVMAAGNLSTDKAIVNRISTAMQSRLIHFELVIDNKAWLKWADRNEIDHRIKSFVNWKPESLYRFDANHDDYTFPCPRTYHFLSKIIKPMEVLHHSKIALIAGTIGEGMAREFFSYSKIYGEIPHINDIMRDPEGVRLGEDTSVQYALSGLVGHHLSVRNADKLMPFLNRLNIDYQVIALRSSIARDSEIKRTEAVKSWIQINARELMP